VVPALIPGLGTIGAALAGAAIVTVGNLAINALFPLPTPALAGPGGGQAAPERLVASAASNRLRPYGRRTLILGRMRWAPDLMAQQILSPTAVAEDDAETDRTVVLPGAADASLGARLDRVAWLDLGIGALTLYGSAGAQWTPGAASAAVPAVVDAGSTATAPVWGAEPNTRLAALAANRPSDFWPLRARAVDHNSRPLSGATVQIDRSRSATRLLTVVGGLLYSSANNGDLRARTSRVGFASPAVGGTPALDLGVDLQNDTLSAGYAAIEVTGGERDWSATGGDPSTTTRSRVELSLAGSYWLEPAPAVAARKAPSAAAAVRLKGARGAPANAVLWTEGAQRVAIPAASGAWTGTAASRNPAALLRAFALGWHDDETGTLIAGTGRPRDTVDDPSLARFYSWCEAHDPPLRCDLVLQDDSRPAEQIERLIAACGRAEISWASGRFGVVWPDPADAPQGLISPANMLPGSLSIAWRDGRRPDAIVASYHDRTVWDARETARIPVPGGEDPPVRERQLRLEGVTEAAQAAFFAAAAAAEEGFRRRAISWRSGRQGALMTRGSVWLMAADLVSGGVTGRLREAAPGRARLDRPVRVGGSIWLALDAPGLGLHQTLALPPPGHPPGGETDLLTLAEPYAGLGPGIAARDTLWRAYDPDRPPFKVRIAANKPLSKSEFEIAAVDESDDYWRFLDGYRAAPQVPPAILLPPPVRIAADGAWAWPQAWTDLGIVGAVVELAGGDGGQGGVGGSGERQCHNTKDGQQCTDFTGQGGSRGGSGSATRLTTAGGGVHTAAGGAGGSGGSPGRGNSSGSGGARGSAGGRTTTTLRRADAPFDIEIGDGGSGGQGGRHANTSARAPTGATGADGHVNIIPLLP